MYPIDETPKASSYYWSYLFVFLVALAVRAFFLIAIDEPMLFTKYPYFAKKLAQGGDIGERLADLSPFYLYFFTVAQKFFSPDWVVIKCIQSIVGALNCLLLYAIGTVMFRKEVGFLAAAMLAVYGNLIVLESTLEPLVFVLLFNMLAVYCLLRSDRAQSGNSRRNWVAGAGLLSGLSIITKPSFLLFLPVGAIWLLFVSKAGRPRKGGVGLGLLFLVTAGLVILPVTIRNYVAFNDFFLVTADAGKVFFHGNGEGATALEGTGLPDEGFAEESAEEPDYAHVLFRRTAERLTGQKLLPSQASKFWARRAMAHMADDPQAHLVLVAKKLFYFFNDYEMHYIASAYNEYKASLAFPFLRYGVIASLGLFGMVLGVRTFRRYFLAYGVVFVYLLSGLLFLVQSRYRTPAVPYLCLFSGYALLALKEKWTEKRTRSFVFSVGVLAALFVITSLAWRGEIHGVDQWQLATKTYYRRDASSLFRQGRYEEAVQSLDRCIGMFPKFVPAWNMRGRAHVELGELDKAFEDFTQVVALSPQMPAGHESLGFLWLLRGDAEKAKGFLERAVALGSANEKVKNALSVLE